MSVTHNTARYIASVAWRCHTDKHGYATEAEAQVCCDGNLRPLVKKEIIDSLDQPFILTESYTKYKIKMCKECLYGDGHPFYNCPKCPGKAVAFPDLGYVPTNRQYLERATDKIVFRQRVDILYTNLKYRNHRRIFWQNDKPQEWFDEEWLPVYENYKELNNTYAVNYERYCDLAKEFLAQHMQRWI